MMFQSTCFRSTGFSLYALGLVEDDEALIFRGKLKAGRCCRDAVFEAEINMHL
jgi:hypothetical protein